MPGRRVVRKGGKAKKAKKDPLFPARPRNYTIGNAIQHKRDLGRFVKWPRYVRVQRQRKILKTRLKVPPALEQFKAALDRNQAAEVFKLLAKYSPETKAEKRERIASAAAASKKDGEAPAVLKFGLNHVTQLIESKKAKLVAIANDVDPIELVVWLPALCRKMDVPYVIVKNRGRLGTLVHQKRAAVVALTKVNGADAARLESVTTMARAQFNDNADALRKWGGGKVGLKTQRKLEKREALIREELAKKAKM